MHRGVYIVLKKYASNLNIIKILTNYVIKIFKYSSKYAIKVYGT